MAANVDLMINGQNMENFKEQNTTYKESISQQFNKNDDALSSQAVDMFSSIDGSYDTQSTSNENDSFKIHIPYGTSFKSLCDYLQNTSTNGHFVVVPEGLLYCQQQQKNVILNSIEIFSHELPKFELNSESNCYAFPVAPATFRKRLGKVPCKGEILIWKESGDSVIKINVLNYTDGVNFYHPGQLEYNPFNINDGGFGDETNPLCVVKSTSFSDICGQMLGQSAKYVTFSVVANGLIMTGYNNLNQILRSDPIGCDNKMKSIRETGGKIKIRISTKECFKVNISIIKAFKSLSQLAEKSCIKFYTYMKSDKLSELKILCHVGSYGILRIYLKDIDHVTE